MRISWWRRWAARTPAWGRQCDGFSPACRARPACFMRRRPLAAADARRLAIDCAGGTEYPALGEDESYTLDVSGAEARITAATAEGAIHGLATFAQLIQPGPDGFEVSGVHI